jgi:hypothetical protein
MNNFLEKYPELFDKDDNGELIMPSCGIFFPPGWSVIVNTLCEWLVNYKKKYKECFVTIGQIKEKWGGLRVYLDNSNENIEHAVSFAELMAARTCEVTGLPGTLCVRGGWYKTLSTDVYLTDKKSWLQPRKRINAKNFNHK